jgi:hypothetical protein
VLDANAWRWIRVTLVVFVLAWILGPRELRDAVPILVVFLIALGLEVAFVATALRRGPGRTPDRAPQQIDRERYGFPSAHDEDGDEDQDEDKDEDLDAEEDDWDEGWWDEPASSPLRRFAVGLALIAALVAVVVLVDRSSGWSSVPGDRRAEAVARFSQEASVIAEKRVSVRCDEARDYVGAVQHADGVAVVGGELAIVTPEICHDLYRLAFDGDVEGSRTGRAIAVLAHEAWHLRGEGDESTAECYALQSGVALGRQLGLSQGRAAQLMRQQLTENALRGIGTFEYRLTAQCRNGGELDLDPTTDRFP